jgi:chromosome segregation ATPase
MGLTVPGAETPSLQQSANLAHQLHLVKDLLSAPLTALVGDSNEIRNIFEQIESQLPEPLQIKLWPASNLPFFRVEVNKAQQRIEARRSQASLKADISQKCKALNQKKATLDTKADVSANMNRLDLLKKELAEFEEKVRTTKELIQAEEASIANSKQEIQEIAEQIQAEFAEISTLSRQIVTGDDKDDEAIIARADAVRTEAIHAIEEFLNQ